MRFHSPFSVWFQKTHTKMNPQTPSYVQDHNEFLEHLRAHLAGLKVQLKAASDKIEKISSLPAPNLSQLAVSAPVSAYRGDGYESTADASAQAADIAKLQTSTSLTPADRALLDSIAERQAVLTRAPVVA